MTSNQRRSVVGIAPIPHLGNNLGDRMQVIPLYRIISDITLWTHKLMGLTATQIVKVNSVPMTTIKKIMGV